VGKASQMQPGYLIPSSPTSERLEDLLSRMTMDEKLAQLTSYWFHELQDGREFPNAKLRALLTSGIGQISRVGGASTSRRPTSPERETPSRSSWSAKPVWAYPPSCTRRAVSDT
jgi:hypothetical protein